MQKEKRFRPESVVSYLKHCSYHQLMAILREVLPDRDEVGLKDYSRPGEYAKIYEDKLALCLLEREPITKDSEQSKKITWKPWKQKLIAYPMEAYGWEDIIGYPPSGFWGTCPRCKVQLACHLKGGVCPICGDDVNF